MLQILIADDHEIVRRGLRDIIGTYPAWRVCGEAADGAQALEIARRTRPQVAVIDVKLPVLDGISVTQRLRDERLGANVLLFTMCDDSSTISAGIAAGARGYVLKSDGQHAIEAAIADLAGNRPYFSPEICNLLIGMKINAHKDPRAFTGRELEVARRVADGLQSKAIAQELGLSVKTVQTYRENAMRKAEARSTPALVRFLVRHHLIVP